MQAEDMSLLQSGCPQLLSQASTTVHMVREAFRANNSKKYQNMLYKQICVGMSV